MSRVLCHGIGKVVDLVRKRLERRAGNVVARGPARDAKDGAAGVRLPPGRTQARERRHNVDAARVLDALCHPLGLGGILDNAQLVAKPLDEGARHKDRALERVFRPLDLGRGGNDRGDQVACALALPRARCA
jgi:hypothetical protein